jgi:hypothetical protein
MKIIGSALLLLTVLSVSILAQTSSATEPILTIKRFAWYENVNQFYCNECPPLPEAARDYIYNHRKGKDNFAAWVVLKNLSSKSIKSVNLDFVFRDTATEQEFLTYKLRSEREIGRGQTKEISHKIAKGKEPDNFRPVGPSVELVGRTRGCFNGATGLMLRDRKTRQWVRIRDDAKLIQMYPCYYTPTVTRIEYTDGSVWQP